MCLALAVAPAGYYAWRGRPESARETGKFQDRCRVSISSPCDGSPGSRTVLLRSPPSTCRVHSSSNSVWRLTTAWEGCVGRRETPARGGVRSRDPYRPVARPGSGHEGHGVQCSCVYPCLPGTPHARAASRRATGVVGYEGPYGNVRNSDAETGWSLRPDGRRNDGTLPRRGMGASRVAPFLAPPVSACTDICCGSMPASRHIVSRNRAACALASSAWTSAPTAWREQTSTHRDQ